MDNLLTANTLIPQSAFETGATFLIDKPLGWTSFDVVNKLRWGIRNHLQVKKYKVGHAGTLDPLATGLLIVCIGKHTKKIESFQGQDKIYTGTIKMYETTASYDAEFLPNAYYPRIDLTRDQLQNCAQSFVGGYDQYPPIFSALKKNGKALYKLARQGKAHEVEIQPRPISIEDFQILDYKLPYIDFKASCSKGTYIRSLAFDFGRRLDSGAYLSGLRRTAIGDYNIEDAWQLEHLISTIEDLKTSVV